MFLPEHSVAAIAYQKRSSDFFFVMIGYGVYGTKIRGKLRIKQAIKSHCKFCINQPKRLHLNFIYIVNTL